MQVSLKSCEDKQLLFTPSPLIAQAIKALVYSRIWIQKDLLFP